jgi:cytoskeleton protein RodZ
MSEKIGRILQEAREAQGHTLEEVEKVTRIRAKFLEALEADNFAALPSATHARGFLRNYAQFLGLEPEQILALYAEGPSKKSRSLLPTPKPKPPQAGATPPRRPTPGASVGRAPQVRSRFPRLLSPDVLVAGVITLILGLLLLWGGSQLAAVPQSATAAVTLLSVTQGGSASTAATPEATNTVTPLPAEATATLPLPTPLPNYTGVNVIVLAEQRTWVGVKVDGTEIFAGLLAPGESKEFVGQQVVEVVTGNAQGTHVIWNGNDQGTLGELGEVVVRLWTLDGMVTPTPTITPTLGQ